MSGSAVGLGGNHAQTPMVFLLAHLNFTFPFSRRSRRLPFSGASLVVSFHVPFSVITNQLTVPLCHCAKRWSVLKEREAEANSRAADLKARKKINERGTQLP